MMRTLVMAIAFAIVALGNVASAQGIFDAASSRVAEQLQSDDASVREGAIRALEQDPGNYPPMLLFALPQLLTEAGRDEDGLRWKYFAIIRFVSDVELLIDTQPQYAGMFAEDFQTQLADQLLLQLPQASRVSPQRRRRLFQEAVRLEERTPRNYVGLFASTRITPSSQQLANTRRTAVAWARAIMDAEIARTETYARGDAEIVAQGVMSEAAQFIPETLRDRVRATRTVRIDELCASPLLTATPAGTAPQAFVAACAPRGGLFRSGDRPAGRMLWLAAHTLEQIGETRMPRPTWSGLVAARGGVPQALFQHTDGAHLRSILVGPDGRVSVITTSGNGHQLFDAVSPSGRYGLRQGLNLEVIDFESGEIVYRRDAGLPPRLVTSWYLAEIGSGRVVAVGLEPQGETSDTRAALVTIDVLTGQTRRLLVEGASSFQYNLAWGTSHVAVNVRAIPAPSTRGTVETYANLEEFEAARDPSPSIISELDPETQSVVLIDLETMGIVWSGLRGNLPAPRDGFRCADAPPAHRATLVSVRDSWPTSVSLPGLRFQLLTPERAAATNCAFSADGGHLVIVAPPFVHLYAVAAE